MNYLMIIGGSTAAATSKMERFVIIANGWKRFVIIVNGWKPLSFITKHSILDVVAALDPPLIFFITSSISVLAQEKTRALNIEY